MLNSAIVALAFGCIAVAAAGRVSFDFDEAAIGSAPDGFFFAGARQSAPGVWEVAGAGAKRHLVHFADPTVTMRGISVAGVNAAAPADLRISTRLRLMDGDRAGGLFWRYRDSADFYFVSIFLSVREAALIRVTAGNRITLDRATGINLDPEAWHTMTVVHNGEQIVAHVDGIPVLRGRDRMLTDGGRAGVWSAGNSTTAFDDVTIEDRPE
jgi:hypothetical protein